MSVIKGRTTMVILEQKTELRCIKVLCECETWSLTMREQQQIAREKGVERSIWN